MRRELILDGNYAVYEDGSIFKIKNGVETPAKRYSFYGKYDTIVFKGKGYLIHRRVATAFIPNPENKPEVNHIDGNKLNNAAANLEWVTRQENAQHAWRIGLNKKDKKICPGCGRITATKFEKCAPCRYKDYQIRRDKEKAEREELLRSLKLPSDMSLREKAAVLYTLGFNQVEIAKICGVSRQRINVLVVKAYGYKYSGH